MRVKVQKDAFILWYNLYHLYLICTFKYIINLMKVKIISVANAEQVSAIIKVGSINEMPSIQQNWRFNFDKALKKLRHATGYLLVVETTQNVVEGCMIFQLINQVEPYMAFIEIAPHNRDHNKRYDRVAGCLIAYAFLQSIIQGKGEYKGLLQFDVLEENKEHEIKLMKLYAFKYNAKLLADTTMVIMDQDGEDLVNRYLI